MSKSKINKETVAIIKDILDGKSYWSIAQKHGIGHSSVSFLGHELGIKRQFKSSRKRTWDEKSIDTFLLSNNSTIRRVSNQVGHSRTLTEWKCSLCGHQWLQSFCFIKGRIERGGYAQGCEDCGKNEYSVYHDFLNIMNEQVAYFLGVYMAKGIKLKSNLIRISSSEKEKLEKIADLISCTYPIKEDKNGYHLFFHSRKMQEKLPNKNHVTDASVPRNVTKKYITDFLRGYVDFKGSAEVYDYGKAPIYRITLTGNEKFLCKVKELFSERIKNVKEFKQKQSVNGNNYAGCIKPREERLAREYQVNGILSSYCFMDWIYNSEVNPLRYVADSKYNAYLRLKERVTQKRSRKKYIEGKQKRLKELLDEFHSTLTFEEISKKYGVTYDQVKKISSGASCKVEPRVKEQILSVIKRKKDVKKQIKELKTRVKNKAGIGLHPYKEEATSEMA